MLPHFRAIELRIATTDHQDRPAYRVAMEPLEFGGKLVARFTIGVREDQQYALPTKLVQR